MLTIPTDSLYKFIAIACTALIGKMLFSVVQFGGHLEESIHFLQQKEFQDSLESKSNDLTHKIWTLEEQVIFQTSTLKPAQAQLPAIDIAPAQAAERFRLSGIEMTLSHTLAELVFL